jgi:putative hydrolase of the HAD superfamily
VIRAVGFDLDDTLLDHRSAASSGLASLFAQQGWVYEGTAEFGAEWQRIEQRHFGDHIVGKLSLAEQRRKRLRDFLAQADIELPDSELDELFEEYLRHYAKSWVAFPDALPVLENLCHLGFRMAVLTNGLQEQQEAKLAHLGL